MSDRIKHISHLDLDGYGCTILSEYLNSIEFGFGGGHTLLFGDGYTSLETLNIQPNQLKSELKKAIDQIDDYKCIIVTDLAINEEIVEMVQSCKNPEKILIFDHHLTSIEELPWNIRVQSHRENGEELTCATELYANFFLDHICKYEELRDKVNYQCIRYFANVVRAYDTYEFNKNKDKLPPIDERHSHYYDAPRLNSIFHILPKEEFRNYIYDYFKNEFPIMNLTHSSERYPWIDKVLELEQKKNELYVESSLKKMIITPFEFDIYKNNVINRLRYTCGVVFAEKNGPMIGNTACSTNEEIDFCAVVSNNQISFYTNRENVDVSVIAKLLGGGGHKEASGFTIPYQSANIYNINHFYDMIKCAGKIASDAINV